MNCPSFAIQTAGNYFVIALVPCFLGGGGGGGGAEMCCHFVAASKWLKNQTAGLFDKTKTNSVRCQANAIINPIRPGGLRGPDDQTHSCQSETSYPMMPKLCDF